MPTFKRQNAQVGEGSISESMLPTRGSNHSAFVEMTFSWGSLHPTDRRYRSVTLPKGFAVKATSDPERFEIKDRFGYVRAEVTLPGKLGPVPVIKPVRRYEAVAEKLPRGWRMAVTEWGTVVVRGQTHADEKKALEEAKSWLNEHRAGWQGYTAAVNFARPAPGRRIS